MKILPIILIGRIISLCIADMKKEEFEKIVKDDTDFPLCFNVKLIGGAFIFATDYSFVSNEIVDLSYNDECIAHIPLKAIETVF